MVSAAEFAELCGVTVQRIYELETDRRQAAADGARHPFPTPVVKGVWLKSAAERYAATRKRKPGRRRDGTSRGKAASTTRLRIEAQIGSDDEPNG
jgi:hypothetical protein